MKVVSPWPPWSVAKIQGVGGDGEKFRIKGAMMERIQHKSVSGVIAAVFLL